jgi:hypothetical protein
VLDWPAWLAVIERKRRLLQRRQSIVASPVPGDYFLDATCSNFALDGITIARAEVIAALGHNAGQRKLRARAAQRIRNHIAILHSIEAALRLIAPLKSSAVIRWYTSISSGLSMTALSDERMIRLDHIIRRINSPQLRLQPALQDIVRTHGELLADPLFPSFNGILSRLLLRYHLGRCALPFALLDGGATHAGHPHEVRLTLQLLNGIDRSFDLLLA